MSRCQTGLIECSAAGQSDSHWLIIGRGHATALPNATAQPSAGESPGRLVLMPLTAASESDRTCTMDPAVTCLGHALLALIGNHEQFHGQAG